MSGIKAITADNRKSNKSNNDNDKMKKVAKNNAGKNDDGSTVIRYEYDLDEMNAMEKKLEACERTIGLHIDPERGETVSKSQMYLEGDTGSYEYVRTHMSNIIKHIFNSEDYPKVVEDEEKHKIIQVKTSSGMMLRWKKKERFMLMGEN